MHSPSEFRPILFSLRPTGGMNWQLLLPRHRLKPQPVHRLHLNASAQGTLAAM